MSIERLLKPSSVAVVGATEKLGIGGSVCSNLAKSDFAQHVYFINPKREEVFGKKCFRALPEIPELIDLTVICVPQSAVPDVLEEVSHVGCHAAVCFASGYSETGTAEGRRNEEQLVQLCREKEIALMGPNCAGFLNYVKAVPAFGLDISEIKGHGQIGLISQSGQICLTMLDMGLLEYSYVISAGNSSVMTIEDYMEFLVEDADTKVIAMYLEGITNPARFVSVLKRAGEL